jgi:hypothetical protein
MDPAPVPESRTAEVVRVQALSLGRPTAALRATGFVLAISAGRSSERDAPAPPRPHFSRRCVSEPGSSPLAFLMVAEITQLQKEHPDVDPKIVQAVYLGYMRRAKPPSIEEAREYVQRVITNVDPDLLRRGLGMTEPPAAERPTQPKPRRGRPKGTRSVPRQQIIDVFRSLRKNYGRPPTQAELAANLNPRIELRTLQAHLTDYGLPWPIE